MARHLGLELNGGRLTVIVQRYDAEHAARGQTPIPCISAKVSPDDGEKCYLRPTPLCVMHGFGPTLRPWAMLAEPSRRLMPNEGIREGRENVEPTCLRD